MSKTIRKEIIETMTRRWLSNPASLKVARRRKDGSPISFAWGKMRVRCKCVFERADELSPSPQTIHLAESFSKMKSIRIAGESSHSGFWEIKGATATGRDEITIQLQRPA